MQYHENIRLEDPDRFFAAGGPLEALLEAKKAGKIRYIGFTGHKDPPCICACWKWRRSTTFISILRRCR